MTPPNDPIYCLYEFDAAGFTIREPIHLSASRIVNLSFLADNYTSLSEKVSKKTFFYRTKLP